MQPCCISSQIFKVPKGTSVATPTAPSESGPACSDRNRHAGPAASFYLRCLNATWADVPYCQAICHSIVARNAKTEASDVNCMGKKACSMDPPVIDHVSEVGNSILQRRIIGLMAAGHRLVTVRSPITRHVVHVAVMTPENASIIDRIPLWRAKRLIHAGAIVPDTGNLDSANELLLSRTANRDRFG